MKKAELDEKHESIRFGPIAVEIHHRTGGESSFYVGNFPSPPKVVYNKKEKGGIKVYIFSSIGEAVDFFHSLECAGGLARAFMQRKTANFLPFFERLRTKLSLSYRILVSFAREMGYLWQ